MQTHNLGCPRIGNNRELKKACEQYWSGKIPLEVLVKTGQRIRQYNWQLQKEAGIDLIPSNDFSFYDQVLDMSLVVGAIPERYHDVVLNKSNAELDLCFAMARGYQKNGTNHQARYPRAGFLFIIRQRKRSRVRPTGFNPKPVACLHGRAEKTGQSKCGMGAVLRTLSV